MKSILTSRTPLTTTQAAELGLINERAAAARLGVSVSTLKGWRELGRGPMAYQVNEHDVMYLAADIRTFEALCLDSFHDFHGADRPSGVEWVRELDADQRAPRTEGRQSFKSWLAAQPDGL